MQETSGHEGGSGWRSVVLVEDDPGDAFLVTDMLADVAPSARIVTFASLRAALEAWPDDVDCALLDLGLPDAIGLEALDRLRAHLPDLPVVVLTGRVDDGIGPQALAAGAQDFLVKGQVDASGLDRSLRYAVERGRATVYERDLVAADLRAQENSRLQRGLLPSPMLTSQDLALGLFYRPGSARDILGGDFYDVVETASGVHLLIGDVSGHGLDEAALGVALRIAWRALVLAGLPTPEVLRGVQQVLLAERDNEERYATVAMVSLSADRRSMDVVLCGHPAPMLITDGAREVPVLPYPILTLLDADAVEPTTVELGPAWGVLLYTDGLVEGARSPGDKERFGAGELARHLDRLVREGAPRVELPPLLLTEAERGQGGPLTDDVAVLLMGNLAWWC